MKTLSLIICLQAMALVAIAQGSSCTDAISLSLDGAIRTYPVSSSIGSCVLCTTTGYSGTNGRITFFQFTTDNTPQCVSVDVTASSNIATEVALYGGCISGSPNPIGGYAIHSMCMNNGSGIWAQDLFSNLSPNTTYYLRVRTASNFTGNLNIAAKYNTPANNSCAGATPISTIAIADNNACHKTDPTVLATDLCAVTLENTAWYTYQVQNSGSTTISIENIACNNGDGNSNNGFQIGFFRGSCNGLIPISCSNGAGGTVTATASGFLAGERVYVAIDGYSGSNCTYTIRASNALPLRVSLKSFTGLIKPNSNLIQWVSLQEVNNLYYEIERSINGATFQSIGRVNGKGDSDSETQYSFEDEFPVEKAYYRLKDVDIDQRVSYSKIIELSRSTKPYLKLSVQNPVQSQVNIFITKNFDSNADLMIVDMLGNIVIKNRFYLREGLSNVKQDIDKLPQGNYLVKLTSNNLVATGSFIKTTSTITYK